MRRVALIATAAASLSVCIGAQQPATRAVGGPARADAASKVTPEAGNTLVSQYCVACHSERGKAGGLALTTFDAARIADNAAVGEKMIRKLRAGMMPPPGAKRPDRPTVAAF